MGKKKPKPKKKQTTAISHAVPDYPGLDLPKNFHPGEPIELVIEEFVLVDAETGIVGLGHTHVANYASGVSRVIRHQSDLNRDTGKEPRERVGKTSKPARIADSSEFEPGPGAAKVYFHTLKPWLTWPVR